jgi:hypothetical protein
VLTKLHAAVVFSVSIILSGCNATPETFSEIERGLNEGHSGLTNLKNQNFHINFKRYQVKDRQGNYSHKFGDFRFSFTPGNTNTSRDLINLNLLDMPMYYCYPFDGCNYFPAEIADLQVFRNYLSSNIPLYRFERVYYLLNKIDANLAKLDETNKKKWLEAFISMNPKSYGWGELTQILKTHADRESAEYLQFIAEDDNRKKKIEQNKEKARLKKKQERTEYLLRLSEQRAKEEKKRQGISRAKKLINDPNMIGHKFCRDGELQYIGLVNYVGSAKWGSLTEQGQMQATLEGLSPDKKMAKLRAIGYATSGTLQYKNDTTPSLDGLSIPSGQVFWDNKNHWYSCPN